MNAPVLRPGTPAGIADTRCQRSMTCACRPEVPGDTAVIPSPVLWDAATLKPDLKKAPQSAQPREGASTAAKTHRRRRCGSKFVAQQDPKPSAGKRPGSGAHERHCLSLPVVSVVKEPLPHAGGPWGHSFYVLSVTYRKRKFKMVLSKCCQKFKVNEGTFTGLNDSEYEEFLATLKDN